MVEIKIQKQDSVKLYKIRKTLKELTSRSGHGTELISVYIPKGKQLHEVITILKEEQGTADNIKSDLTRTHVVDSLSKVVQRLKLYKKTPERGLVVFCGALPREVVDLQAVKLLRPLKLTRQKTLKHSYTDVMTIFMLIF